MHPGDNLESTENSLTDPYAHVDAGILVEEGIGTRVQWCTDDFPRLCRLKQGAVERLQRRWPNEEDRGSDSLDGSSTRLLRAKVTKTKVVAAFKAWQGYTSYIEDFEDGIDEDPIIESLKQEVPLYENMKRRTKTSVFTSRCEKCLYPPCECGAPRSLRKRKYSSQTLSTWRCSACTPGANQ